ncbi:MAG: excinuclease ABC subunit UvrA, partial [Planctomycetota bacterium]
MPANHIELRGVAVHNLQYVDLDVPYRQLVVVCGVSGSGKTSLALDTLFAEGQRRYIESFSAYTRQFLERIPKPAAERIDGIPPAIAVNHKVSVSGSNRATVGTTTELVDYLRLLFARIGEVSCPQCGKPLRRHSPSSAAAQLSALPEGTRFMLTFSQAANGVASLDELASALQEDGFHRWIVDGRTETLTSRTSSAALPDTLEVVVDRLAVGAAEPARVRESIETAMGRSGGRCDALIDFSQVNGSKLPEELDVSHLEAAVVDDRTWHRFPMTRVLRCDTCELEFPRLEPRLFSFNSPRGACPTCEGFGNISDLDFNLIIPDPGKSLAEGAIAPWTTPAYEQEMQKVLDLAPQMGIPVDVPFGELSEQQQRLIKHGSPDHEFGGVTGFFDWLERRKYKMHIRVFLSRWRGFRVCEDCRGARLAPMGLSVHIGGRNIAEICQMRTDEAIAYIDGLTLTAHDERVSKQILDQVQSRLRCLRDMGLEYLSLDRPMRTLSTGERQRVALTSALGSSLVNMLYVLDEPSTGLHPSDVGKLIDAVTQLRDRGNCVVVVEHEEAVIDAADFVVEIGPGAGADGGRITYAGGPAEMRASEGVLTGDYLSGRRGRVVPETRRAASHGWIRISGAEGNNLDHLEAEFPLGVLCVVTGVSGSGKSSLIEHTLYPALCHRKKKDAPTPLPFGEVFGDGQLDDVMLVDQSPIGRSPRSNPVTYIKAFDAIRKVFAETLEARTRNIKASHFSFNVEGGRCQTCQGDGVVQIDMQFLADVVMVCSDCQGRRYRREILDIRYRGKNIADVLEMTVRQALSFFRGQPKVQSRLQKLVEVGLDYLRLGQAANTLSAGEAQRLKLAGYLSAPRRGRTLFLMDEPTTGLHFADIVQLLDCFDALLSVGHSLIIVEHNLLMMQAADYIIDLGPGAAEAGGKLVAAGTPEEVANCAASPTAGTIGATMEAALQGIKSVAMSQYFGPENAQLDDPFDAAGQHGAKVVRDLLAHGVWGGDSHRYGYNTFYNVNFPPVPGSAVKGVRAVAQGRRSSGG